MRRWTQARCSASVKQASEPAANAGRRRVELVPVQPSKEGRPPDRPRPGPISASASIRPDDKLIQPQVIAIVAGQRLRNATQAVVPGEAAEGELGRQPVAGVVGMMEVGLQQADERPPPSMPIDAVVAAAGQRVMWNSRGKPASASKAVISGISGQDLAICTRRFRLSKASAGTSFAVPAEHEQILAGTAEARSGLLTLHAAYHSSSSSISISAHDATRQWASRCAARWDRRGSCGFRGKTARGEELRQVVNEMRAAELVDPRHLLLLGLVGNGCGRPPGRSAPDR